MRNIKKAFKSITLNSSSKCSLKCSYCYINKVDGNFRDLDIIMGEQLASGEYYQKMIRFFKKFELDEKEVSIIEIWGGEPTYGFDKIAKDIPDILGFFSNVVSITFSTNFISKRDNIFLLLDALEQYSNKPILVKMQISYDGSEEFISERGINEVQAKGALVDFFTKFSQKNYKNVALDVGFKPTIPLSLVKKKLNTSEGIIEYDDFWVSVMKLINKHCKNKISLQSKVMLTTVIPDNYTQEDGLVFAKFLELYMQLAKTRKLLILPFFDNLINQKRYDALNRFEYMGNGYGCSVTNHMSLTLDHKGDIITCHRAYVESFEDERENKYQGRMSIRIDTLEDLQKYVDYMESVSKDIGNSSINIFIYALKSLAKLGYVNPAYMTDNKLLYRDAVLLISIIPCVFNNIHLSGVMSIPILHWIPLLCNGYIDLLIEWRKQNGSIQ